MNENSMFIQFTVVKIKGFPFPVLFLKLPYSMFAIQLSLSCRPKKYTLIAKSMLEISGLW